MELGSFRGSPVGSGGPESPDRREETPGGEAEGKDAAAGRGGHDGAGTGAGESKEAQDGAGHHRGEEEDGYEEELDPRIQVNDSLEIHTRPYTYDRKVCR